MFDIIIPVYNAIHHVRSCIASIARYSTQPVHLYVVDDKSDAHTRSILREVLADSRISSLTLIENESNLGYLRTINKGIAQGSNPYVICLNSDTVVSPGYLDKLRRAFETDSRIGIVNPVSNWANWTRVCESIPQGFNILDLAQAIDGLSKEELPDIYNASGFCFAVRRELFDSLGLFDEVYGMGYWEETDFCMRALDAQWRVVVDDSLYIYHYGWGSFLDEGRDEHMKKNEAIFRQRWHDKFTKIERRWKKKDPVAKLRQTISKPEFWRQVETRTYLKASKVEVLERLAALRNLELEIDDSLFSDEKCGEAMGTKGRVIYIVPAVALYGGIISVLQVVNQLIVNGYSANIATYGKVDGEVLRLFPTFFNPHVFPDEGTMLSEFPECDVVAATRWDTAYHAAVLKQLRPELNLLYFVQDFEPDFYLPEHPDLAALAERSYSLVRRQIVKTHWLERKLAPYGGEIRRIPLGLNLDFFFDYGKPRHLQVLALARPSSLRRNFDMVREVYTELYRRRPDIRLALYGEGYEAESLPFPVRSYGRLTNMREIADALNESAIMLDCSTFQGFGRPGLEAMACGTASVLTHEGGITQYAKHEHNCLLTNPLDRAEIVSKVLRLGTDRQLRSRLIDKGYETVREYPVQAEGRRTAQWLEDLGIAPVHADLGVKRECTQCSNA